MHSGFPGDLTRDGALRMPELSRDRRSGNGIASVGLTLLLAASGCAGGGSQAPTVTRSDSAGVEIVSVAGDLPALDRSYEERFTLGGAPDGPESFYQLSGALVDVGPNGVIHVLDPLNHRIVRFSPDGAVVGTVGRSGGGPAEFGQPFAMAVTASGVLVVADRTRPHLLRLSAEGEPLPSLEIRAPIFGAAEVALVDTTPVFRWWQWTTRSSGISQLIWGSEEPQVVAQMAEGGNEDQRPFPSCPQGFPGRKYLDPGMVWTASAAGVAIVAAHDYEIRVVSAEGRLERIIRRDVTREPVTTQALLEHLDDPFMANTGRGPQALCPVPLEEAIRIKGHMERVPAITALALSRDGEIWARRGAIPFERGRIDVYDANGTPLGTLPAGTPFPLAFTPGGIASVREDAMGVSRLVVWREDR